MVTNVCDSSSWKVEARKLLQVEGQPRLNGGFLVRTSSLPCMMWKVPFLSLRMYTNKEKAPKKKPSSEFLVATVASSLKLLTIQFPP